MLIRFIDAKSKEPLSFTTSQTLPIVPNVGDEVEIKLVFTEKQTYAVATVTERFFAVESQLLMLFVDVNILK